MVVCFLLFTILLLHFFVHMLVFVYFVIMFFIVAMRKKYLECEQQIIVNYDE